MSNASKERENTQKLSVVFRSFLFLQKGAAHERKVFFLLHSLSLAARLFLKKFKNNREVKSVEKHFYDVKNEMAYFKKVVRNMDLDDIKSEKKHTNNDIHYEEFLDENSTDIFQIMTESKYKGSLSWIDLIQNEKLHRAIEKLTEEEKYLITLLFYENRTQKELSKLYEVHESTMFYKINKIIRKIKRYMLKR